MACRIDYLKSQHLAWMECPVCLQTPRRGPLYACRNGHMLCKDCKPKVATCPICRDRDIGCRNLFAEKVLENILKDHKLKCKFSRHGCTVKGVLLNIEKHEVNDCKFRIVPCPTRSCNWSGPLSGLIRHVNTTLCGLVNYVESFADSPSISFNVDDDSQDVRPVFSKTEINDFVPSLLITQEPLINICAVITLRGGKGFWYIYAKSLTQVKSTLRVHMKVQKYNENRDHFIYTGDVASCQESEEDTLKKGNYLMLRDDQVKKLMVGRILMNISIRIFQE